MGNGTVSFEIVKHIGVIGSSKSGWNKELNLVSWNESEPKYDIRDWDSDHRHMSRGITLTSEQVEKLRKLLNGNHVVANL